MSIVKNLNFQYLLTLLLFVSPYFGVISINLTVLSILIYFFLQIKNYKFELIDKVLILLGLYFVISSIIFHQNYLINSISFFKFIVLFLGVKLLFLNFSEKYLDKINLISLIIIILLIFDLYYQKIFGQDIQFLKHLMEKD